jgi:hypothetical protein
MSEESPSGENMNGNNSIAKRKRKKTISMVDLSIRKEGSSVISNYLHNSSSAIKRLKKGMDSSPFHDRVKGEDGVSCFISCIIAGHFKCIIALPDNALGGYSYRDLLKFPF